MAEENKNTEETKTEENKNNQNNTQQQSQNNIDVEKVKSDAVSEYLKGLGYDDESLKGIIEKHKKDEESNSTELEKAQKQLTKTTQELVEERKARMLAEAKLSALKLGAKTELVDDLVTVAMSKVTKNNDIDKVIAEIKAGTTGSVYFAEEKEQEENKNKNLTAGANNSGKNTKVKQSNGTVGKLDDFMERMKAQRAKTGKSSYWKN